MSASVARRALGVVLAVGALNAFAGGVYGFAGAQGVPLALLDGSPFRDYLVPSAVLFFVVGGSMAVAAVLVLRGLPGARVATITAGVILVGWIAVQVAIIGWMSWLQPFCAVVGVFLVAVAASTPVGTGARAELGS